MKLLTRLRELRNQHTDSSIYDYLNDSFKLDNEIIGIGATTSPDIARINLESHTHEKLNSSKK